MLFLYSYLSVFNCTHVVPMPWTQSSHFLLQYALANMHFGKDALANIGSRIIVETCYQCIRLYKISHLISQLFAISQVLRNCKSRCRKSKAFLAIPNYWVLFMYIPVNETKWLYRCIAALIPIHHPAIENRESISTSWC